MKIRIKGIVREKIKNNNNKMRMSGKGTKLIARIIEAKGVKNG